MKDRISCQEITNRIKEIKTKRAELEGLIDARNTGEALSVKTEISGRVEALIKETEIIPGFLEQYKSQIDILKQTGIVEELSDDKLGIIGIDNKEYPIPTLREIRARVTPEKQELIDKKHEQGFSKLLLVPFGMSLGDLIEKYKKVLLKKKSEGKLFATDGTPLDLNENDPANDWASWTNADTEERLVYFPSKFDQNDHYGKTKKQMIDSGNPWQVILIEDLPDLPAQNAGKTIGGRKQLEANSSSIDYLNKMDEDEYQLEEGLTPEMWLVYAITNLQEKSQQIDDWQGQGKLCYLFGSYFPASGYVLYAYWYRDYSRAVLGSGTPTNRDSNSGARSSVKI